MQNSINRLTSGCYEPKTVGTFSARFAASKSPTISGRRAGRWAARSRNVEVVELMNRDWRVSNERAGNVVEFFPNRNHGR